MALGLTRDSYLKLSSLSSTEDEAAVNLSYAVASERLGTSTEVALPKASIDKKIIENGGSNSVGSHSTGTSEASPAKQSSYGAYSGFDMDYYADYENYKDPYAPTIGGGETGGENKSIFCCIFPWLVGKDRMITPDDGSSVQTSSKTENINDREAVAEAVTDKPSRPMRKESGDEDENSTSSDKLGDKLTERERSAVLARLKISQPDTPLMSDPPVPTGKGLLTDLPMPPATPKEPQLKGILKRNSFPSKSPSSTEIRKTTLGGQQLSTERRSLFPVYRGKEKKEGSDEKCVQFAPMARVSTVKSRRNMHAAEKSSIWWQRSDYDDFKKTGRMVAKAMLQSGSEVWLMTNKSWQSPGTKKAILDHSSSNGSKEDDTDLDNKWWHKFGHSRRGLEHIASMEEGKQRQMNVRVAVRAVLDEQKKQRLYGKLDMERIRSIYVQFSIWARELAVAAGASDEEAVSSNFSAKRHSREFYLEKHRSINGSPAAPRHVPDFMKPNVDLDANTSTLIRIRRKIKAESEAAIHDPVPHSGKSIAQQAAGFGTSDENVSMAAVLSGMGTVSASSTPTRTRVGAH